MKPSDPVTPPRAFTAFINRTTDDRTRSERKTRHLIADNRRPTVGVLFIIAGQDGLPGLDGVTDF